MPFSMLLIAPMALAFVCTAYAATQWIYSDAESDRKLALSVPPAGPHWSHADQHQWEMRRLDAIRHGSSANRAFGGILIVGSIAAIGFTAV